jgi:uncharacterized protein YdbL (DUF1318 family)
MGENDKAEDIFSAFGKFTNIIAQQALTNFDTEQIQKVMNKYEEFSVEFTSSMGMGRESVVAIKQSFGDAVVSVNKLGADLSALPGIASAIGGALNKSVIPLKDAYAEIYATSKVTGVGMETLGKGFKDAGFSIYNMSENMTKVVNIARETGMSVKTVSSAVISNLDMMDKYNFSNGIEGLAKMVTESTKLRISVNTISNVMDKAFKPEGAIEMAASLQRLGVAQSDLLDPLRLMDMSRNDPEEFQKQIAEMSKEFVKFDETTKQFVILPGSKERMMEVASTLGINTSEFAKMAKSAAEFDDKMKKISFSDKFNQEEKELIATMAEMKGGEYKLNVNGEELKIDEAMVKVQNMGEEERKKFFESSQPKSMEDLAKEQLTIGKQSAGYLASIANRTAAGFAGTQTNETLLQAQLELAKTVPKVFSGERFQPKAVRETVDTAVGQVQKGYDSGNLIKGLIEGGETIKKWVSGASDDFVVGASKALTGLNESTNPLIKIFSGVAVEGGKLFQNHEKLNTDFGTLSETINKTNTVLNNSTVTKNVTTDILENSKQNTMDVDNKNEITFSTPLKMELNVTGLQTTTQEELFLKAIKEGKLDQLIVEAVRRGELQSVMQSTSSIKK